MPDAARLRLWPDDCEIGDWILCECVPEWDQQLTHLHFHQDGVKETWTFEHTTKALKGYDRQGWVRTA